ncbi:protein mono-ADP-ribosyltransferase PARP4 isoform X2 [Rhineura floridana]|nr:protein mono-ADP-ribosyltransferase PARP4 isoform X2 [Rhineura floridana]
MPIVGADFIWNSVKERRLLRTGDFELPQSLTCIPDTESSCGLAAVCGDDLWKEKEAPDKSDHDDSKTNGSNNMGELSSRWFSNNDENIPYFPEDFLVAKYDVLEQITAPGGYVVVELQCSQQQCDYRFRISAHYSLLDGHEDQIRFIPTKTSEEARKVYVDCTEHLKKENFQFRSNFPREIEYLASVKLQEMLIAEAMNSSFLSETVSMFVELIWVEALGHLTHLLDKPVTDISLNDVSRAEGILLRTKKALDEEESPNEQVAIMSEFYKIIPHKSGMDCIVTKKLLSNKQDLCQLIRDMLNVHETNLSIPNPSSLSKYRALRCRIDPVLTVEEEFQNIKQKMSQYISEQPVEVLQIYKVGRMTEVAGFESHLGNVQCLYHASSARNFVGILSRGLLLPKMVVEEHGLERTDCGNLGSGIYFSNSISASVNYSWPNKTDGTRLLLICDVALGNCWDTCQMDSSLTTAPSGYDSVHGIAKKNGKRKKGRDFKDDEFVVYRTSQVRIKYVVKFRFANDKVKEFQPVIQKDEARPPSLEQLSQPEDYKMPSKNLLNDVTAGLLDRSGNQVPLKDVHIKGRIIDFVAEVVVFQVYDNQANSPIEAKYVFPLDDTAAVCGFEAFIKGKHIIGEVKEKEKAHQEYREAISQGHGAYLMDQDAPDIFTVSVGNLPPATKVLIKITYITELSYENGCLSFHLPAAVAPWQQDKALNENTQDSVRKVSIKQVGTRPGGFSLDMSLEMPFRINHISSWTHQLEIKKTDCKAVIRSVGASFLDVSGFAMDILIGDVHLPRMWVEKHPDKESEACMLVFQPEFEAAFDPLCSCDEIIICLDCSSSMAGSEIQQAKQIALCALESCHFVTGKISIIKFGTSFVEFPFNPEPYTTDFAALKEFTISATATMGNSDLWKILHYLSLLYPSESKRNILLISDGHIQNEGMTLQIVKKNAQHTRIFTCGVGPTANRHMLRSLSQYGAGAFEYFDVKSKYNWERKIKSQTTRMFSPGCNAISIKWQQFDTDAPELMYAPAQIQSLFSQDRLLIYGFISHCTQATLNALIDDKELQTMVSTTELQKTTGTMLHKLAARAFIRDYEQGILDEDETEHEMKKQLLKSLIIKLSLENSIVTQFTSFVAIEKRDTNEEQTADTLNILELVAKEDVDILPYMHYQPKTHAATFPRKMSTLALAGTELEAADESPVPVFFKRKIRFPSDTQSHDMQSAVLPVPPYLSSVSRLACSSILPAYEKLSSPAADMSGPHPSVDLLMSEVSVAETELEASDEICAKKKLKKKLRYSHAIQPQTTIWSPPALHGQCLDDTPLFSTQLFQQKHSLPAGFKSGTGFTFDLQIPPASIVGPELEHRSFAFGSGVYGTVKRQSASSFSELQRTPPPPVSGDIPYSFPEKLSSAIGLSGSALCLDSQAIPQPCSLRKFSMRQQKDPLPPTSVAHDVKLRGSLQQQFPQLLFPGLGAAQTLVNPLWGEPRMSDDKHPKETNEASHRMDHPYPRPFNAAIYSAKNLMETKTKKKKCAMFTAQKPLRIVPWPQLFNLQNQDGFWQLTLELGSLLDLDVDYLVNVSLAKKGINSLGPKGKEKLLRLMATLLVLQVIHFNQLEGLVFKSLTKLSDSPRSWAFDPVKKAVEWARRTEQEFPAICQRFELGKDWDFAIKKLLCTEETRAGTGIVLPPSSS